MSTSKESSLVFASMSKSVSKVLRVSRIREPMSANESDPSCQQKVVGDQRDRVRAAPPEGS